MQEPPEEKKEVKEAAFTGILSSSQTLPLDPDPI